MAETFYRIENLRKAFGDAEVLRSVTFELKERDVFALIGPSGAGKTTLLRSIDFLDRPDGGVMTFKNKRIELAHAKPHDIREYRKRTSFVFQNFNLFLNKTALENVTEGLIMAHGMPKREAEARGMALLEKVGMKDHAGKYPSELSGGQQQRVAIARALAPDPDLILLDEPTSALDPERIKEIEGLLKLLAGEGRTMIIVTHDLAFARKVSTRTALLEGGVIVEEAPTEIFFTAPKEPRTEEFLRGFGSDHS
ncbi:amino acid ABC transporter ATP-binding protein [Sutterella seckii]|uniref:Amino acid ABC transporter ATP-binding protein n=1 Tax=Sutterella seckii TaxID=1944635 RepID=A0A6I1EKE9_9BURK|nr:amino acid ABC transporter ATP-binding protein [Sutterella seckii]KAB7660719.1 amino acid ABC transporter ATP-binding protein [Sutterella seckii]